MMSHAETLTPTDRKEAFLETLSTVQEKFNQKGIDYRIVGSIASHAYLDGDDPTIAPLNFNRPGAALPEQRVPDIDLVVPRADLVEARHIRAETLHDAQPVKLGLATSTMEIDFRPDQTESYLTHKNIFLPVDNDLLLVENDVNFDGIPIKTVPIDTLTHTFGTFGGRVRQKDMPLLKGLIRKTDVSDPRTQVFHEFQRERRIQSPGEYYFSLALGVFNDKAPSRVRNEFYRAALKGADLLGKR